MTTFPKKIFPILLLLCALGCKQQDAGKPLVVASASKTKVLFLGMNNPVSIVAAGIPRGNIKVKVDDSLGAITGDSGKYVATVKSVNYKIRVYKKEGDKEIFLDTLKYKVIKTPSPFLSVSGYSGDCTMPKELLLKTDKITTELSDFIFDIRYPIVSYNFSAEINGLFIDVAGNNNEINEDMKKLFKQIPSGNRLLLENIYVQAPEGKRKIRGMVITIQ